MGLRKITAYVEVSLVSWVMILAGVVVWASGGYLTPIIQNAVNIDVMGFNISPMVANVIIGTLGFGLVWRGIGKKLSGE